MKLRVKDKVLVISGRDKGKKGEVVAVLPKKQQVIVENINTVKRHVKPNQKQPKGGIVEVTKPIATAKVMVIDPVSGKPARVGYRVDAKGNKERVFKVSTFTNKKITAPKLAKSKAKPKKSGEKKS